MELAFAAGVKEVMAEIEPTNLTSSRVVQNLGFAAVDYRVDEEGESVVQWVKSSED